MPSSLLLGRSHDTDFSPCALNILTEKWGEQQPNRRTQSRLVSERRRCLRQVGVWVRAGGAVLLMCRLASSWWHLDDAGLVDDACASVAFLDYSDDPRSSWSALTSCSGAVALHLWAELGGLLSGQTHQQPTWRDEQDVRVNLWRTFTYLHVSLAIHTRGLCRHALKQVEQVSAGFTDGTHLG